MTVGMTRIRWYRDRRFLTGSMTLLLCFWSLQSWAGIRLTQNRLVYKQGVAAPTLTLENKGGKVYLVQAMVLPWPGATSEKAFTLLPPLFRLEANSSNKLMVMQTGGQLPTDRESVFMVHINAIPSGVAPDGAVFQGLGRVSVSLGMSIKLFYRPQGLQITPAEAYGKLTYSRRGSEVVVNNPTPYYQTFAYLHIGDETIDFSNAKMESMVAPFGQVRYRISVSPHAAVSWATINDYGGVSKDQRTQTDMMP